MCETDGEDEAEAETTGGGGDEGRLGWVVHLEIQPFLQTCEELPPARVTRSEQGAEESASRDGFFCVSAGLSRGVWGNWRAIIRGFILSVGAPRSAMVGQKTLSASP